MTVRRRAHIARHHTEIYPHNDTLLHVSKNTNELQRPKAIAVLEKGWIITMDVDYHEEDMEAYASLNWGFEDDSVIEDESPIPAEWTGTVFWDRATRCFTTKDNNLYIIEFERPDRTKPLVIEHMPKINPKATFRLQEDWGYNAKLKWKQDKHGTLTIDFSNITQELLDYLENAWVIRVENYQP